ncbi:YDG domain-containing protein [Sphingomonas sp. KR3-1]|uniref:YDG domain-containing protein n=1 Tax=Sphingomonas sp. KR3-1 TaxID=3156611 RepID=UPI0032B579BE
MATATALLAFAPSAWAQTGPALPSGGVFTTGEGQIAQPSPNALTITQSSRRGVIDWREFSIAIENQVRIDNGGGATLNRVTGGALSRIDGMLSASGSVYLMNPNGVVIGPSGKVLTGGDFVATTRNMDAGQFMAGGSLAASGNSNGMIANGGSIVSQGGSVVMIARAVSNDGTIEARQGRVTLAAANDVLMATTDGKADGIYVSVGAGGGDITQTGRIAAAAVALKAANGNIFALAGNRDGLVQATGTATIKGELWLTAPAGKVEVAGMLKAANADGSGGQIVVSGRDLALTATANLSAAGIGGGEVLIGTSGYGSGADLARSTAIGDGARIAAGGPAGGGRIETSGHGLDLGAATILPAAGGSWLIDPDDLVIDAAAAAGIVTSLNVGGGTVLVQTTAGGTGGVGDITVASPIVWTEPTGALSIDAYRNIAVNAAITGAGDVSLSANGTLAINAPVSGDTMFAQVVGAVTINPGGSFSGTDAVGIESSSFTNLAGAGAISSSGDRWFIATDDAAGSNDGGLTPDYYLYDYLNTPSVPAPGNGRFYRQAPSISFTLGAVTKTYDGTTLATLDSSNVNLTGLVNGDVYTLDGSYATEDAGIGIDVTATNFQASRGGIAVYGYDVTTPSVTAAVGRIDRAALTAAIVGNPTKTYNATTAVALTAANFQLSGVVNGESVTINGAATSAYDSANAGPRTVSTTFQSPNFTAGAGTSLANYILPISASGAGLINPAPILISGVTANDKVYDGTTAATLNTGGATIFGVVPGDTVTLDTSGAAGVFTTKNVGNAIAVTGAGFALAGTSAANYAVSQPTGLAANITRAALVVTGLTANDKVYDGTFFAGVNTAGLVISGLVPGDDVLPVDAGGQISFAQKDVGQNILVTISGVVLIGGDAGNYDLSFSSALTADITQRPLSITGSGMPSKVYDGNTNAFVLASQVGLSNVVAGETVTLSQATGLTYADKNVGIWDIDFTLSPSDFQAGPNTLLSNYLLPSIGTIQGEITPAPLVITIIGNPTKAYDGNANAALGPGNFQVDGFITGEGATVTQASGQYSSSDAGVWTVSANLTAGDFATDPGTLISNYYIPSPVSGVGTVTRRDLGPGVVTVDITGNPTKVYDGTTIATLTPGDYTLGGFIAGEGATITETVGTYGSANAGQQSVTVQLDPGDFAPFPGTNLANYTLPDVATGIGTILRAQLSAAIIGNPTKVYNGQTRIGLNPGSFSITGLIAGESITVTPGNIGNYDDADAGSRTITALFPSMANFVAGPGTLLSNYLLPAQATGPGTITPAPLNILNVRAQDKVYDQTTLALLTGTATLFGVVSGDTVLLSSAGSTGTFATANAGSGIGVTVSGFTISGADAGNYALFQPAGLTANIARRGLTIVGLIANDKFYDSTTAATLGGSPTLVGVLSGDTVALNGLGSTASFLQSNVGTDLRVNIGGFAIAGAQAGNYALSQPSGLTADINPVMLTGTILGNPAKTYDGTTSVSLTGANYALTGFIAGEGGTITQSSGAAYDSANAGARTVTATLVVSDFVANAGTLLSNYVLPTAISGAGTINQAALTATIIGNPTKVYDATTTATLTSANYALAGFVAGEGATVTQTAGTYASKNVGSRAATATLGSGDFTANGGTLLANYVLPTTASGTGTITQASVQVIGILANDKVYDGTTVATLDSSGGGLSGVLGSDAVGLVSSGAAGSFATRNVGTNIAVTATGYTLAGGDAANYLILQPTGLAADITQATIQLLSVTKTYDATISVPTANGAYTLFGVVAGDSVAVDASGITGSYADKNVGTGKLVTLSGVAITGADAANYSIAATVTNQPIGTITPATLDVIGALALDKTYDQNTVAQLDNSGTVLSGVLASDVVNLSFATTGNFDNANAGLGKPVTTTAYSISGADAGNYTLVQPHGLTADINPLEIFLASVTKTYDGTTALPSAAGGYAFTGVLSGDTVVAQTSGVTGQYNDSKNVGTAKPVTVDGLTLTGASGGNYFIRPSITGSLGTITQAVLSVAIIGNPTRVYDATNAATLATGNYQLTGFAAGEGATVTEMAGSYDSANQGARTITAILDAGDFTSNGGTLLGNYVLPTSASGAGTIDPRLLTVSSVIANDKVYDGTTVATLNSTAAALNNVVPGDTVALNSAGATGTFASPHVGTGIAVTASGYALTNNPFGNYTLQQPTGLSANITAALLTLTRVTRTYDASTNLPGNAGAYTLSGVVAGDDVAVDAAAAAASGSYADKNVNTGILVTIGNLALTGAAASNYSIASPLTNASIGEITPATLSGSIIGTPTRIYDGTTAALLASGNFQLTGFFGGEGATVTETAGRYDSANTGARTIAATLDSGDFTANGGTSLSNYILPTGASGAGQIDPKALAVTIIGTPTRTYDGTTAAALTAENYDLTGFVSGQSATVTQAFGAYASKDAGSRTVTATLGTGDFLAGSGTSLSNYILPTTASGAGLINQAMLTAAIIGTPTRVYDATTAVTLNPGNYQLTGFVSGEGATVSETAGVFNSPDAGPRTVTATLDPGDFVATGSTLLSNYVLPVSARGGGRIDRAVLGAAIIGNPTRIYDGTTLAALTTANYQLTGFVGTQGASVTQTAGAYSSANAGTRAVTASLTSGDFAANGGTLLSNYVLPTTASGQGQIDPALLTAAIVGTPTKSYDGTAAATLTAGNYTLNGFVAGEGATVTRTAGSYASANAGTRIVTTSLSSGDFTANSGTLLANYVLPLTAIGTGLIDRATLQVFISGIPVKDYDGTTLATLTPGNYTLTGFVAGEGATVTQGSGNYASANAGLRLISTVLAGSDFAANSGTLLANYTLPTTATGVGLINRRALAAAVIGLPTKIYDGTDVATLTSANYAFTGFVAGEGGTITETDGTYASANAGLRGITVNLGSADFVANSGTLLINYLLPLTATGPGRVDQAMLSAAIIGNPSRVYDGTTAAALASSNYALTGFVAGEGATITETAGSYDSANVGSRTVTASLDAGDFAANSGTTLGNYVLPTSAAGTGTIGQAMLTAAIIGTPTRAYDGTTLATLTSANYALAGFAAGESATISQATGIYSSANAGSRIVTAVLAGGDFTAGSGTDLSNYILPTSASGAGLISQAALNAVIIGTPTRTYDGTTRAMLTSANYALAGFVTGEGATVTQAAGTYASPNAGTRSVTAILTASDFTADSGTLLSNYALPASAIGAGVIDRAALGAIIVGNPSRAYDGTTVAALTPANYALTGFVAGESATVSQGVGGYAAPDAGVRVVDATLAASDFIAGTGTLLSNYVLPASATGPGTIDRALLVALIVNDPTRVYDGTTAAALTAGNFTLTGFAVGEGATVTQTAGAYGSPNAGMRTVSATLGASDFAAIGGTSLANYVLPMSASGTGHIEQAVLTAAIIGTPTKTYDGTVLAMLGAGNYALTGFIAGEGATITQALAAYDSADAGSRTVTAILAAGDYAADSGTLLDNYALPTSATGSGLIDPRALTATIIGDPTRAYDGATRATLAAANYALTGFVGTQGATVTQTQGSYGQADAGIRTVTATLAGGDFAADSGTSLTNYILPTSASGLGRIDRAILNAVIIGTPTRAYDGTDLAALTPANFALAGFVSGEGATVTQASGVYASPNAGTRIVTATVAASDFAADSGTALSNYVLPTSAAGLGVIDQATLTAILIGDPTRAYDGTTRAALTSANFALAGFVAGEGAIATQSAGSYASADAGPRLVTVTLAATDFAPNAGTLLDNYALPASAAGLGTIDRAMLTAAIIKDPTRTYDGTTRATLTSANYALAGFVAGQSATVTETIGAYSAANAGARTVTATLDASDFAAGSGTALSNYVLPVSAAGTGHIGQAALGVAIVGNPTRIYDGTSLASLTSANFALTGFIAGEGATVVRTTGAYDSANAGTRTVTAALTGADYAANSGTLLSNYLLPTSATGAGAIDRANLTVTITGYPTKPYDGGTDATLVSSDYSISGFVAGEGASITQTQGSYADPEVGVHSVTATLDAGDYAANGGTLLANYNLPTTATGQGEITKAKPAPPPDCILPWSAGCREQFPSLAQVLGNRRFFIPYPSMDSVYFAHTNGFAALPGILWQSSAVPIPDGLLITSGTPIVNSAEQILQQGQTAKQWTIRFPPPLPIDTLGVQP